MLILHYTGMATAQAALDWLCAEESQVSSHYFVDEAGLMTQMVPESARAWHAGESNWKGETDTIRLDRHRDRHVGHREAGSPDFPDAQIESGDRLCRDIVDPATGSQPSGCWRIPTSRRCASRIRARCFPGDGCTQKASATGSSRCRSAAGGFSRKAIPASPWKRCRPCWRFTAMVLRLTGSTMPRPPPWCGRFSAISGPERVDGIADASTIGTLHKLLSERLPTVA
jgi:N-acetylmuramoyl-L-alanine amidase